MIIEVSQERFRKAFSSDPHPFLSEKFLDLNKHKVERLVRLLPDNDKPSIGLIAGVKDGVLLSPFSAPFGGFHFKHENVYINEIDNYLGWLTEYLRNNDLIGVKITLPPDLYHRTFNSKVVNSMVRNKFRTSLPEITNWIELRKFSGVFSQKNSREYYHQALRNGLKFHQVTESKDIEDAYKIISDNRAKFGRPIYMSLEDILNTGKLWPVDFFKVCTRDNQSCAAAIFYRSRSDIAYAVFWGDNETGRKLRAMDFIAYQLISFYKDLDYSYLDMGISTEMGVPNEGLLRFKESHEAVSSLRFKYEWHV